MAGKSDDEAAAAEAAVMALPQARAMMALAGGGRIAEKAEEHGVRAYELILVILIAAYVVVDVLMNGEMQIASAPPAPRRLTKRSRRRQAYRTR